MMSSAGPKLTFTLEHEGPIPLADFTGSLSRIAARYGRFARGRGGEEDVKLYIAEIRHGSTVVDLINNALPAIVPIAGYLPTLVEFGKDVVALVNLFKDRRPDATEVSISDCDDVRMMMRPVIHTEGGGLSIAINGDNNVVQPIIVTVSESEAKVIDNRAALVRSELGTRSTDTLSKVLFQWHQIKRTPGVEEGLSSPDRGVIGAVDKTPRKVLFAENGLKEQMYLDDFNPWSAGYLVDVKLLIGANGRPEAYLIQAVHEHFDLAG